MLEDKIRILVVEARFYDDLADALLQGAADVITAHDAEYDVVTVPGALEIPLALGQAVAAGLIGSGSGAAGAARFDGCVVLGCVIRGETSHYDIVCNNANHWLMHVAVANAIPLGNAILTVDTEEQLDLWIGAARQKGYVAVDTETDCIDCIVAKLVGVSLAVEPNIACYIPVAHAGADLLSDAPKQLPKALVLEKLKGLLEDPAVLKIAQNLKYDWLVFRRTAGIEVGPYDDTMLASYALDAGKGGSLITIASIVIGQTVFRRLEGRFAQDL